MKHLLNNLSNEEKNNIREQHTGGMKVITENFYKLLNSKLGDVKPLTEQSAAAYKPMTATQRETSGVVQQGQSTPKKAVEALSTYGFSLLIPKALEYLNGSGTSDVKVQKFCQLCNTSNAPINANGNQMADSIRDAVQGVGTNEESLFNTFNRIQTFDDFCSLVKAYKNSYSTDLYTDLDDDIDAENEWVQIMRPIRDAILRQKSSTAGRTATATASRAPSPNVGTASRAPSPNVGTASRAPSPKVIKPTTQPTTSQI
jgi:hypothetical protein